MDTFIDVLEKNGIKAPEAKPWKPYWVLGLQMKAFDRKWQEPEAYYMGWLEECEERNKEFNKELREGGYETRVHLQPRLDSFKTPEEALNQIFWNYEKWLHEYKNELAKARRDGKAIWVKKILSKKPENCVLVVVKNRKYVPYHKEARESFETSVREKKEACICSGFGFPEWLAVDPNSKDVEEAMKWFPFDPIDGEVIYVK